MDLGHGVFAGIDIDGHAGSNAGFVIGDDGVLVVDSFFAPAASKALLAEIRKRTQAPVRYVVNTHYHIDHTAGNGVFKDAGATIVAQRHVADWMHSENPKFFGDKITPEQKAAIAAIPAPTTLVDKRLTLEARQARDRGGGASRPHRRRRHRLAFPTPRCSSAATCCGRRFHPT